MKNLLKFAREFLEYRKISYEQYVTFQDVFSERDYIQKDNSRVYLMHYLEAAPWIASGFEVYNNLECVADYVYVCIPNKFCDTIISRKSGDKFSIFSEENKEVVEKFSFFLKYAEALKCIVKDLKDLKIRKK